MWHCPPPHAAAAAATARYLLPAGRTAANPPHTAAAGEWDKQMDRQTDRRTPYRFIDPAPHTIHNFISPRCGGKREYKETELN